MRFESLMALAFGPFQNRRLDFAAGMNVIHGPNESGKTSWHAALFAGLCGMRRGKGQRSQDAEFTLRHRPWGGSEWKVALTLDLQDGRNVELIQDLDARTATVTDTVLGRDCAAEILYDGAPDGSLWLGLNREVFPAIASVRQAQILELLKEPLALQQYLQRAAAARGSESTAAQAIEALLDFRSQQVGLDRANVRRPLRLAREGCDEARERLRRAVEEHLGYEELLRELADRKAGLAQARRRQRRCGALRARMEARQASRRLEEVDELLGRFPDGAPSGLAAGEGLMQEAAGILEACRVRPALLPFPEPAVGSLEKELAQLPARDDGDSAPDPAIAEAYKAFRLQCGLLEEHQRQRPEAAAPPECGAVGAEEMRSLAAALEERPPEADPELGHRWARLAGQIAARQTRHGRFRLVPALLVVLAAAGLLCLFLDLILPGAALLAVAAGFFAWVLLRGPDRQLLQDQQDLKQVEASQLRQQFERDAWVRRQDQALQRTRDLGLPAEPGGLRAAAGRCQQATEQERRLRDWHQRLNRLESGVRDSGEALRLRLAAKGEIPREDPEASYDAYLERCRKRVQRRDLEQQLERARTETARAEEAARHLAGIQSRLRSIALRCGLSDGDDASLAANLEDWLRGRAREQEHREEQLRQWQQLQNLLAGRSPGELMSEASRRRQLAEQLSKEWTPAELDGEPPDLEALLAESETIEREVQALQTEVVRLQTRLDERAPLLALPAEAEEELKAAEEELERVTRLDRILGQTLEFLEQAQNQVHRSIAPALADSIRGWLPSVTAGRYTDARVDPRNLMVSVLDTGGLWREAPLLSRGTTEQIYLLLRIALARYLIRSGEVAPLVLDDVTVQSDAGRTRALLETLLALSQERQIILFSQEEAVREWASERLCEPRHKLILLAPAEIHRPTNHTHTANH